MRVGELAGNDLVGQVIPKYNVEYIPQPYGPPLSSVGESPGSAVLYGPQEEIWRLQLTNGFPDGSIHCPSFLCLSLRPSLLTIERSGLCCI